MTPYHKQAFINAPVPDNEDAQAILAMHHETNAGYSNISKALLRSEAESVVLLNEAITIHHETGLGPRQLAQQRAELIAALDKLLHAARWLDTSATHTGLKNCEAINGAAAILAQCQEGKV